MGSVCSRRSNKIINKVRVISKPRAQQMQQEPYFKHFQFSSHEEELIALYLPDFACTNPSTAQDHMIVVQHWEQLHLLDDEEEFSPAQQLTWIDNEPPIVAFFDSFFCFLYEEAPQLKKLMFHASFHCQGQALMHILDGVMNLLLGDDVIEKATQIAKRHARYGVKCEYYNPVGVALLKSLELVAPQLWTCQVHEAWRKLFCHVALLVLTRLHKELNRYHFQLKPFLSFNNKHKPVQGIRKDTGSISEAATDTTTSHSGRSSGSEMTGTTSGSAVVVVAAPTCTGIMASSPVNHVVGSIASRRLEMMRNAKKAREERDHTRAPTTNDVECPYSGRKLIEMPAYVPSNNKDDAPARPQQFHYAGSCPCDLGNFRCDSR